MIQRIILGEEAQCPVEPKEEIGIKLNVHDDFKISHTFVSMSPDSLPIPLDQFDLIIEYYIKGRSETYVVSKIGSELTNCILDQSRGEIKSIFCNHGLKAGKLYGKATYKFKDDEMPDGTFDITENKFMGVTLIEDDRDKQETSDTYGHSFTKRSDDSSRYLP